MFTGPCLLVIDMLNSVWMCGLPLLLQLLSQCVEELGFDWSVQTGAVGVARSHLTRLRTLDTESALLRSAAPPLTP